jgi:hypothetical protein
MLLFAAMFASSAWRALRPQEALPTATVPASFSVNTVYISDIAGNAETELTDDPFPQRVQIGETLFADVGRILRVPQQGELRLGLANRVILFLGSRSEISLQKIAGTDNQATDEINLNFGRLLVASPNSNDWLTSITQADNTHAEAAQNSLMGVLFDPAADNFEVHCLRGGCRLSGTAGAPLLLSAGEMGFVIGNGEPEKGAFAQYDLFQNMGDPGSVPRPTVTLAPTRPTSTARPATPTSPPQATATMPLPTVTNTPTPVPPSPTLTVAVTPTATLTPILTVTPILTETLPLATPTITATIATTPTLPTSTITVTIVATTTLPPATPLSPTPVPLASPSSTPVIIPTQTPTE